MASDPATKAAEINLICWAIRDTLHAARSHAARPADRFAGSPEFALLWDVEKAIADLIDSEPMRALKSAGIPPEHEGSRRWRVTRDIS